jgi:hypothetical protein
MLPWSAVAAAISALPIAARLQPFDNHVLIRR